MHFTYHNHFKDNAKPYWLSGPNIDMGAGSTNALMLDDTGNINSIISSTNNGNIYQSSWTVPYKGNLRKIYYRPEQATS